MPLAQLYYEKQMLSILEILDSADEIVLTYSRAGFLSYHSLIIMALANYPEIAQSYFDDDYYSITD